MIGHNHVSDELKSVAVSHFSEDAWQTYFVSVLSEIRGVACSTCK